MLFVTFPFNQYFQFTNNYCYTFVSLKLKFSIVHTVLIKKFKINEKIQDYLDDEHIFAHFSPSIAADIIPPA